MLHSFGTTVGPPQVLRCNIEHRPKPRALPWLNLGFEIKHSAYRKAGGMIPNPRPVGLLDEGIGPRKAGIVKRAGARTAAVME
jgi:hypothetical protein